MSLLIGFFTVLLILTCLFMVLIILMQRPRSDSGLGAALGGGGAAESAFGADTGSILSRSTIYCVIIFFVLSFGLYLGHMYVSHRGVTDTRGLPEMKAADDGGEAVSEDAPAQPDAAPASEDESGAASEDESEEVMVPLEEPASDEEVPLAPIDE